jgi:hypothetical protein
VVRIPTLLHTALEGASVVPHYVMTWALAIAYITPFPCSGFGAFGIIHLCGLPFGELKNGIANMAAQRVRYKP